MFVGLIVLVIVGLILVVALAFRGRHLARPNFGVTNLSPKISRSSKPATPNGTPMTGIWLRMI